MDYIYTSGITPQSNLPKCSYNYPYKEICETYKLCVPKNKPDIETILELHIDTSIEKSHILYTPMENKLIIYGNIHIKILYVANTSCQSVHSAHFDIPFCTFILSSNICNHIVDTTLFVEDIFVKQFDSRNFYISTLMLVYPEFNKQKNKPTNNFNNEYNMNHSNSCDFNYDKKTNTNSCINHHKYNESDIQYWNEYHDEFDDEYHIQYDTTPTTDTKIIHEKNNEYKIGSDIQFDTDYNIQFDMTPSTDTKITNDKDNEYKIESNIEYDIDSDNATDTNINLEQGNEYFEYEWE